MGSSHSVIDSAHADYGAANIRANMQKLERRGLWVWGNTIIVILALTAGVCSLSVALLLKGVSTVFGLSLGVAVRVLVVLVLVFTIHMIFQHIHLRGLQHKLAEEQIQAEVFRRLAMFDPLTGLYNRRFAEQRLGAEVARSERKGHPLTIVLLDLNEFKEINDTHGHGVGDLVLKAFAERLNRSIRGSDLAVRWGGDEFMLVLVDCNITQLQRVLIRLQPFDLAANGKKVPVNFAVGWKEYQSGDQVPNLLEEADRNLYLNKQVVKGSRYPAAVVA
jgi:diguanylate cyclase (GGDEF)-like protein